MKRKFISILLSMVILSGFAIPNVSAKSFYDVDSSHWAYDQISEMVNRGVLSGYPDGYFRPDNNVTRAEFAKIMTSAAGLNLAYPETPSFKDVSIGNWCYPYVEAAKYYLSGYELHQGWGYYYQPNSIALREDIAVAMVKLKGYDTLGYDLSMLKAMFSDWQSISSDAQKYVAIGVEKGLISGYEDGTFRGQKGITRAEAATLLWKAYQYGNDNKSFDTIKTAEPTKEPEATPQPTPAQKPQETQEPTPTPTPEETKSPETTDKPQTKKLPYKADSLTSASVSNTYLYATQDNNDNLYYYDTNADAVYKLNMENGRKTKLLDVSSLTYEVYKDEEQEVTETVTKKVPRTESEEDPDQQDSAEEEITDEETSSEDKNSENNENENSNEIIYDEITEEVTTVKTVPVLQGHYKDYKVDQLYYNTGNNKLLLIGKFQNYKSEKSYNDKKGEKAVEYEVKSNSVKVYSEFTYEKMQIYGNMDNGNILMETLHFSYDGGGYYRTDDSPFIYNFTENKKISSLTNIRNDGFFYSNGNKAYYCYGGRVYEYSFSSKNLNALWDDSVGNNAQGLNNKIYYAWNIVKGEINKISSDGKPQKLDINTKTDVEVNDFYNMPTANQYSNSQIRMFITNDESFIFYDTAAAGGTWRKISKQ